MEKDNTEKQQNTGFQISRTKLQAGTASPESLHNLPTPARPVVDASDVVVPEGYVVEPVMAGLSFPTDSCIIIVTTRNVVHLAHPENQNKPLL